MVVVAPPGPPVPRRTYGPLECMLFVGLGAGLGAVAEAGRQVFSRGNIVNQDRLYGEAFLGIPFGAYFPLARYLSNQFREGYRNFANRATGIGMGDRIIKSLQISVPSAYTGYVVGLAERAIEDFARQDIVPNIINVAKNPLVDRSIEFGIAGMIPAVAALGYSYRNEVANVGTVAGRLAWRGVRGAASLYYKINRGIWNIHPIFGPMNVIGWHVIAVLIGGTAAGWW